MLRAGIIAYGDRVQEQFNLLSQLSCFDITAVLLASPVKEEHSIPQSLITDDFDLLNRNSDLIFIFAARAFGFTELANIIKQSKAIYLKKTGHLTIDELKELAKLAIESNCKVQIGNHMLFREVSSHLISESSNIKVIDAFVSYPLIQSPRFNISLTQLIHPEIAFLIQLAQATPIKTRATGCFTVNQQNIDMLTTRIDFDNGLTVNMHASVLPFESDKTIKIYQPKKVISGNYIHNRIDYIYPSKNSIVFSDIDTTRTKEYLSFYNSIISESEQQYSLFDDITAWEVSQLIDEKIALLH